VSRQTGRVRTAAVVAPSPVPLRTGGAERHWEGLRRALEGRGIATDIVKLPVREHTLGDLVDAYESFALLDLSHVDLVVTGKYPAWMVQHPRHVVWMLHPLRGLYDTYNPAAFEHRHLPSHPTLDALVDALSERPATAEPMEVVDLVRAAVEALGPDATGPDGALSVPGPLARGVVQFLDRWALDPARVERHAAISGVVAGRSGYFPGGVDVEVVLPPSCLEDPPPLPPGQGFLAVGRLDHPKRMDLAIEAVRRLGDAGPGLTVVGDGPDRPRLEAVAAGDPRIRFAGWVDDDGLRQAYLDARAVVVTPKDEDFGYVTIEAMQHGRAVVTTTDSGGPAELATDGHDALVVEPTPRSLAAALGRLATEDGLAGRLGAAARATAAGHAWPVAVERLLAPSAAPGPPGTSGSRAGRGRIVAASTYSLRGARGGGQERATHLLAGLAADGWEVVAVCLGEEPGRTSLGERFEQVVVSPSPRHAAAEVRLRRLMGNVSVTDAAASVLWPASPELVRTLRRELRGATAALAVQPYLAPALVELAPGIPLLHDSHNVERSLKAQMYPHDEAGRWMLARVEDCERLALRRAALVAAATQDDRAALTSAHGVAAGHVVVVPNGVDVSAPAASDEDRAEGRAAALGRLGAPEGTRAIGLFVGSAHEPNVEAARLALAMATEVPELLLVLVGSHCERLDRRGLPPNARLLGEVDDRTLATLMTAADVALNPMVSGGGSNLKVLGYFAAEIPVVSTAIGLRGLEAPGELALICPPDTARMAAAVRESLRADNSGRVDAARRRVEAEYDWRALSGRFATAVATTLPSRTEESDAK
jgi:glycosyltransferase involved in cell wall biosynthesis